MPNIPAIPETITVHLGSPDSNATNVTESFSDYIKNVASSEIYPTWPEEAIRANVLAQISVALNRVYTEYYRSRGYDFDITDSPAYDQKYTYRKDIFSNVSQIVDEIFNSYIRRSGNVEPLFAQFCDGVEVVCDGLSQWGSVELSNQGLNYEQILKRYYGNDIEIVRDVPIEDIPESAPPVPLREGDTGRDVEQIQIKLNRISRNFPGIPRISPQDGFFDTSTTAAVTKFQEVFDLTPDGIVGRATWYRINFIYNAVKKLFELNSEGLRISELETVYTDTLKEGDESIGVLTLQYYLNYIGLFLSTVSSPGIDGVFGTDTKASVLSFQRAYGLPETGEVDRLTWDNIENVYFSYLRSIPYEFSPGVVLPFPGRVLRPGMSGDDVLALQEYLNYISDTYPEIPKITADGIYGPGTDRSVNAFKEIFNIPGTPSRVTAILWSAITNVYDDLYNVARPASAAESEYPYDILALSERLPIDVGAYSRDVLTLKALISSLSLWYPGGEGFENNMMYTKLFSNEVRRMRRIFGLKDVGYFDRELLFRVISEITLRKKLDNKPG